MNRFHTILVCGLGFHFICKHLNIQWSPTVSGASSLNSMLCTQTRFPIFCEIWIDNLLIALEKGSSHPTHPFSPRHLQLELTLPPPTNRKKPKTKQNKIRPAPTPTSNIVSYNIGISVFPDYCIRFLSSVCSWYCSSRTVQSHVAVWRGTTCFY